MVHPILISGNRANANFSSTILFGALSARATSEPSSGDPHRAKIIVQEQVIVDCAINLLNVPRLQECGLSPQQKFEQYFFVFSDVIKMPDWGSNQSLCSGGSIPGAALWSTFHDWPNARYDFSSITNSMLISGDKKCQKVNIPSSHCALFTLAVDNVASNRPFEIEAILAAQCYATHLINPSATKFVSIDQPRFVASRQNQIRCSRFQICNLP